MWKALKQLINIGGQKQAHTVQLWLLIFYGLISIVSSMALGTLTQDVVTYSQDMIIRNMILFIVSSLAGALIDWLREEYRIRMVECQKAAFRKKTAECLMKLDYSSFQQYQMGDLINRANLDTNSAGEASTLLITGIKNTLIPVILIAAMFFLNWKMTLVFAFFVPFVFLWQKVSQKSTSGVMDWKMSGAAMTSETLDLVSHKETLKAYRLQNKADEWVEHSTEDYRKKGVSALTRIYTGAIPTGLIGMLPILVSSILGGHLLYIGEMKIQTFVTIVLLASFATNELQNLVNVFLNMPSRIASADRLFEIWNTAAEKSGTGHTVSEGEMVVELKDISFQYVNKNVNDFEETENTQVLNNISLYARKGEKIALVGLSGCGKSTVIKLVTGLYPLSGGSMRLWGKDISDWDLTPLRSRIGFMQQETHIFFGSIYDNIACAIPDPTREKVEAAAEKAQLLDWIMQQPDKWDAPVGEKGKLLSGGLKQRVGLARLFLQDAPLLLLDEATASLDTANEAKIMSAISNLGSDKTQIVVAHRLLTITDSDRIYVMEKGHIAECGTHAELIKRKGLYYKLYEQQKGGSADEQ